MDIHHRYPQAVALPILSIFSIALAIPPLILHGKNRNFPATSLIFWSILLNLFNIINSLIWPTDDVASWWDGAGLCDIEVKFMAAGYVGIPGSLACIFRSLAIVLDTDRATLVPSRGQRWRNQCMEILFCVAVPVTAMITHIIWQKSRYLLFAISGCVNNFDESWVSLVFAWIWPPVICLIAAYYCCKYTPNSLQKILPLTKNHRPGPHPRTQVPERLRKHPPRLQQQPQQIPLPPPLLPGPINARLHPPTTRLRCLHRHNPLPPLAQLLLEQNSQRRMEHHHQSPYRRHSLLRPLDPRRIRLHDLHLLRFRPRRNPHVPHSLLVPRTGLLLPEHRAPNRYAQLRPFSGARLNSNHARRQHRLPCEINVLATEGILRYVCLDAWHIQRYRKGLFLALVPLYQVYQELALE